VSPNDPVLVPHPEKVMPLLNTKTVLNLGGIWGALSSGQTVMASDGRRFIWSADSMTVVYSQQGKFYSQTAKGFAGEVRTAPMVQAGRSARFMARVAEVEIKLLMGIVAGASGVGFAAVIGTEVLEFVVENRENFNKWNGQLQAVLKARSFLKIHTPVMYDKLFDAVLKQVYRDVKGKLPDAVTPEIVAFGVGVIVGSVGKKVAAGRFSLLVVLFAVVEQLAVRFTLSVMPGALTLTKEQYAKLAEEIVRKVREAGVTLEESDAKRIIDEVQQHPKEVKQAFEMLKSAFQGHIQTQAH
jgi:hypothetical protein